MIVLHNQSVQAVTQQGTCHHHGCIAGCPACVDEIQAWFLPRGADGTVCASEAAEARRVFKELVTNGPSWMLWAVTGSSMATFWINAAMAPKGGVALMTHHRLVRDSNDEHAQHFYPLTRDLPEHNQNYVMV